MERALLALAMVVSACAQAGPSIESDNDGNILMRIGKEGGRLLLVPFGVDTNEAAVAIATVKQVATLEATTVAQNNAVLMRLEALESKNSALADKVAELTGLLEAATTANQENLQSVKDEFTTAIVQLEDNIVNHDSCLTGFIEAGAVQSGVTGCPKPKDGAASRCDEPSPAADDDTGALTVTGHGTAAGAIRLFECRKGFVLSGAAIAICTLDGVWNAATPSCIGTTTATTVTTTTVTAKEPATVTCKGRVDNFVSLAFADGKRLNIDIAQDDRSYTVKFPETVKVLGFKAGDAECGCACGWFRMQCTVEDNVKSDWHGYTANARDLRQRGWAGTDESGPRTIGGKKYTLDGDPSVWVKEGNTASFPYLKGVWQDKAMVCADETRLKLPKRKGDGTDTNQYIYWWFRFSLKNE
eukprot:gene13941-20703_t